jgi:hypothetical protein
MCESGNEDDCEITSPAPEACECERERERESSKRETEGLITDD